MLGENNQNRFSILHEFTFFRKFVKYGGSKRVRWSLRN